MTLCRMLTRRDVRLDEVCDFLRNRDIVSWLPVTQSWTAASTKSSSRITSVQCSELLLFMKAMKRSP